MSGITRAGRREGQSYTYYVCPNNKKNPHGARKCPDHIRAAIREDVITAAIAAFLDQFVLGHDRAAMLARLLPASAADQAARRDAQAAELTRRLARNDAAQKGLIAELAQLGGDTSPATTAYRVRIREHYTELHDAAAALQAQLDAINDQAATDNDPALIGELPHAPGFLNSAPDTVKESLYAALGIQCVYRPGKKQVTIRATITNSTPGLVAALLADPRTDSDNTNEPAALFDDSNSAAIAPQIANILKDPSRRVTAPPPVARFIILFAMKCRFWHLGQIVAVGK
jgi:hypothetical protein